MKIGILLLALLCLMASAQDPNSVRQAMAACGPSDKHLRVTLSPGPELRAAPPGQALVYVLGNWWGSLWGPVIRIGTDGKWVGALKGSVNFAIPLAPGVHHFCAQGQGHTPPGPREVALDVLNLEPGRTYYLLADSQQAYTSGYLGLEEVNADEGKLLLAKSRAVIAKPRN